MAAEMLVAILGGGRLGSAIKTACEQQNVHHFVVSGEALRKPHPPGLLKDANTPYRPIVLVDASQGEAVAGHVSWALELSEPIVIGATGHGVTREELTRRVEQRIGVLLAPNFAPGALLLGRLCEAIGGWCAPGGFSPFLEERHHALKKDAPSGTAVWLKGRLASTGGPELPITSTRAGQVPGAHLLGLHSSGELLEFGHTALSREAYGAGAIAACKFLLGKQGVFGIEDWAREMFPWPK